MWYNIGTIKGNGAQRPHDSQRLIEFGCSGSRIPVRPDKVTGLFGGLALNNDSPIHILSVQSRTLAYAPGCAKGSFWTPQATTEKIASRGLYR